MLLSGQKILCVGGNGFIGNYLASRLVKASAKVSVLSRSGPKFQYLENQQINWLHGSVFQSEKFLQHINGVDVVVHTIGTLFDSTILGRQKPGGPGTYESMNRDSLKAVLSALKQPKKVFYLSAVGHPPFIHRYAKTKQQAEELLLSSPHDGYIFKPGFVYNLEHRRWSNLMASGIKFWNRFQYPLVQKFIDYFPAKTSKKTPWYNFLSEFKQAQPTSLEKIGDSLIYVIKNGCDERVIKNKKIEELSQEYLKVNRKT